MTGHRPLTGISRVSACVLATVLCALLALGVMSWHTPALASAPASPSVQTTREPGTMFDPTDRLAPPPMSDPPTQVEKGHFAYYLSCMACHGDRGQGLTDEWRGVLDPADQNCWQSKCHAPNHPPNGFELPRYAPQIIGPGRLSHYQTADNLYEFLRTRMPWQAPGILSDEEYWQLTAFLLDANGVPLSTTPLGADNAADIYIAPQSGEREDPPPNRWPSVVWPWLLAAGALLLPLGVVALRRRHRAR